VFPSTKNVIKVTGNIPNQIGQNYEMRNISFVVGNLSSSSTDSSISCYQLPQNYVIYAAYSANAASYYGYNPQAGHVLLLWNPININPVLVFKILTASATPVGLATLNNQSNSIDGETVQQTIGDIYPTAICFDDNSMIAPSLPPIGSLSPVEFYSTPEYNPSGMPYIPQVALPSKSMYNLQ
jgi:hypothetical protein